MAVRAEHFPFSISPVVRRLRLPTAGCASLLARAARLFRVIQEPDMGSVSAEWLREHSADTPDRWE